MWSINSLINSVNRNDGKMNEKYIEDMRFDENEDDKRIELFQRLLQENYDKWKSKTYSDNAKPSAKDWKSFTLKSFIGSFKYEFIEMCFLNLLGELSTLFYSWWIGFIIKFLLDENATTKDGLIIIGIFVIAILFSNTIKNKY